MKNIIESKLTEEDQQAIIAKIKELEDLLKGKLVALTETERVKYGSINEQNKLLVNKIYDYYTRNAELSTADVDWVEFKKDYDARIFLENALNRLKSIAYQMESTKTLHDYDNYQDALVDYNYAQFKKLARINGYTEKVAELKQFFPRSTKGKGTAKEN